MVEMPPQITCDIFSCGDVQERIIAISDSLVISFKPSGVGDEANAISTVIASQKICQKH